MVTAVDEARTAHDALASMTERLIGEYEVGVPAGSVIRLVARTVQSLRSEGVPTTRLAAVAEPVVRAELDARRLASMPAVIGQERLP